MKTIKELLRKDPATSPTFEGEIDLALRDSHVHDTMVIFVIVLILLILFTIVTLFM